MNDLMTKSFTSYVDLLKDSMRDLEAGPPSDLQMANPTDQTLGPFLAEAESVKNQMAAIREILLRLHQSNEDLKALQKPGSHKRIKGHINSDILEVLKSARSIKGQLEAMDAANSSTKEGTAVHRTRLAVTCGLRKKLKELMGEFQELREKMVKEQMETAERRYFTVTGERPDEATMERILRSSGGAEGVFKKAVEEQGRGAVVEAVMEMEERRVAVKEIERSLVELHQLFMEMAVMVDAQGEQLDDIEHHVMSAGNYVGDGVKSLNAAKDYQRSTRKWVCVGLIVLLVIFLLIFVPVATTFF